jgi:hypothetical protein
MNSSEQFRNQPAALARMRAYCFPGGEEAALSVRAVKTTQRGEIRSGPNARWMSFTAQEVIDARQSSFRWEASIGGGIKLMTVTDAYEQGHGRLVMSVGGLVPVKKIAGPDVDRGELQRYLASIVFCPPALLNHSSLEWTEVEPLTLRVQDRNVSCVWVYLTLDEQGKPFGCCADRPRLVGKQSVLTPWSAMCSDFREVEGMRVPGHLEVLWHLPEGPFTYFREDVTSFELVR